MLSLDVPSSNSVLFWGSLDRRGTDGENKQNDPRAKTTYFFIPLTQFSCSVPIFQEPEVGNMGTQKGDRF